MDANWFERSFVYQVYPLGLCGAPHQNDGVTEHRLARLVEGGWVSHMGRLGADCLLLNPVFESLSHGYDTTDFLRVDCRLGDNGDLRALVDACHAAGIKVLLDTVFNHVGREFWAFRDVRERRQESPYAGWFCIDWGRDNEYGDGFAYECWEGVSSLVRLNHANFDLNAYCADVVRTWEREFDIDGLRLDVAYCLDLGFLGYLRQIANELGERRGAKFLLLGECMFGDYRRWMNDGACDTVTNYEVYKGLWSSMNSQNMHEIAYALERQSGSRPWDLYTGWHMLDFLDNHDVPRIATKLCDRRQLRPLWGLLFGMVGTPSVYYGSEWGIEGEQLPGDHELRPALDAPEWNDLTDWIALLAKARACSEALTWGTYEQLAVAPLQLAFERATSGERVIVAANASDAPYAFRLDARCACLRDLLGGGVLDVASSGGAFELAPFSCAYWRCEG